MYRTGFIFKGYVPHFLRVFLEPLITSLQQICIHMTIKEIINELFSKLQIRVREVIARNNQVIGGISFRCYFLTEHLPIHMLGCPVILRTITINWCHKVNDVMFRLHPKMKPIAIGFENPVHDLPKYDDTWVCISTQDERATYGTCWNLVILIEYQCPGCREKQTRVRRICSPFQN